MNDPYTLGQHIQRLERRIERLERSPVSSALWCDPGSHAFSSADPKRRHMTSEDAEGEVLTVDICGEHLPSLFRSESAPTRVDGTPSLA